MQCLFACPLPFLPISTVTVYLSETIAWKTAWGLMTLLWGLPVMGALCCLGDQLLYCLGVGWSQWRDLDTGGGGSTAIHGLHRYMYVPL